MIHHIHRRGRLSVTLACLLGGALALSACSSSSGASAPPASAGSGSSSASSPSSAGTPGSAASGSTASGSASGSAALGSASGSAASGSASGSAASGSASGSAASRTSESGTIDIDAAIAAAPVADVAAIIPGSTMEKIRKRGQLIVGEALDAPLLSQQDPTTGKVEGFDADLAKALAVYILGKPNVKIVNPSTQTREALLGNGTVDVVFNTYTITTERAKQVAFAGPYFTSGLAVAVKADNTTIKGIDDLGGKTVIVGANTPAVTEVPKAQPTAKIISFGTDPECVQALVQGRGDAYVQDITLLASDAKANSKMKVVGQPFTSEPYGIGLKHGDTQFKKFVNTWLQTIEKDGLWTKIWKASLGTVVESAPPTPPAIGSVPGS